MRKSSRPRSSSRRHGRSRTMGDRTTRVSHPLLRLEVLRPDGSRTWAHRVYCRYQRRSVPAGYCCACTHCDEITEDPAPSVVCSIPRLPEDLAADPAGERTEVGALLREGMIALDPGASIGEALRVLR